MTTKKQLEEATAGVVHAIENGNGTTKGKKILRRLKSIVGISADALHTAHSAQSRTTHIAKVVEAVKSEVEESQKQIASVDETATSRDSELAVRIEENKQAISDLTLNVSEATNAIKEMRTQMENVMKEFVAFTQETHKTLEALAKANA